MRAARSGRFGVVPGRVPGSRSDGADLPQIVELGVDHRVDLLREVALARLLRPLEDVVDRLRPADHDIAGWVRRRAVARDAPAGEELHLEVEDASNVGGREGGGNGVGKVLDDPV